MGCIGLSYDDFCRLTPEQFDATFDAWRDMRDGDMRDNWQRMRMLATITIQPHCKKKITPNKLLPLPWEKVRAPKVPTVQLSADEQKQRFISLVKRGNK